MAGNNKNKPPPLQTAQSTPLHKKDGVVAKLPIAALARYEVNIRAFHPNKNFERWGFRFHGDNRGFSTDESWFEKVSPELPTSRIWQRYNFDMNFDKVESITKNKIAKLKTESNMSDSGPGLWHYFSWGGEDYKKEAYKPRGGLEVLKIETPHGGQKIIRLKSHLAGENHAFATSKFQQDKLNTTIVPTLDVFSELCIRIERVSLYMDISSLTYGDGFPNCESFIKDPSGKKLFLGSHVRIGFPSTHLWGEQKRLMWANTMRIEIDKDGNFGEKLWIFTQLLGGAPSLREDYPVSSSDEICSKLTKEPMRVSSFNIPNENRGRFVWNCGNPNDTLDATKKNSIPFYISALKNSPESINDIIEKTWKIEPKKKTTRAEWNEYHLHRDPNEGRYRDDQEYQIDEKKWKK